jgi:hypothetical protein
MSGAGKVGRALRCPPSGDEWGTDIAPYSFGGQRTARPTIHEPGAPPARRSFVAFIF